MKTLNLHCDYIKFKALKKALKNIEEIAPGQLLEGESKECLVVLTAVEKGDNEDIVKKVIADVISVAGQVNAKNVVLYPYAHLSSNLASPSKAIELMNNIAKGLQEY